MGYTLDLGGIDEALSAGARGVLLCNPHNPVGLVHSREQLAELSTIVDRHGGFVISDEIHAPLTHSGHTFTPYLTVCRQAQDHGITAESGSKAFNLAGLKTAFFAAESDRMTKLITALPEEVTFRAGLLGLISNQSRLHPWPGMAAGDHRRDRAQHHRPGRATGGELSPQCGCADPTPVTWRGLTCRLSPGETTRRSSHSARAKVALSNGPSFGPQGIGPRPDEPRLRTRYDHRGYRQGSPEPPAN